MARAACIFGMTLPAIWPEGAGYAATLFTAHAWLAFSLIALVGVHIGRGAQRLYPARRPVGPAAAGPGAKNASPAATDMP